ncbi:transporter substrate-binding domain-containing protein [Vibrio sp. 99-70-13A1]|uniref:substrate-binding periplasmic protein n=1 Tax=Vibrio sp. 99-70-13A1 TaxID=2607601 RepID=UPI0020A423B7|nr:transporter substrate-binding domain-containing protein [Vibrio sp. 99-70-13A1]
MNINMRSRFFLLAVTLLVSLKSYSFEDMHFIVPVFPPYTQLDSQGFPSGIGTDAVKQVLDSMGVSYTISVSSNHGRALQEVRKLNSDGFFMASQNSERDTYAQFSDPLMSNRWVWVVRKENAHNFSPDNSIFRDRSTVATLLNTNTHHWLKVIGYSSIYVAASVDGLKDKLDSGTISAILIAEMTFLDAVSDIEDYEIVTEQEKEFGLYISKYFLRKNPGFMSKLNQAIHEYKEH